MVLISVVHLISTCPGNNKFVGTLLLVREVIANRQLKVKVYA
jgi:hypothetical protein